MSGTDAAAQPFNPCILSYMDSSIASGSMRLDGGVVSLLHTAIDREASDIHLAVGYPVSFRVHGALTPEGDALKADRIRAFIDSILPERLHGRLDERKNFDFSIPIAYGGVSHRFRTNIFLAQGHWCASLRHVPNKIPTFEWMSFPEALAQHLVSYNHGLVIITGVTGSGKSTTLAGLIDVLNRKGGYRIITVEEPIEYVHQPLSSTVVTQREVGRDVDSFFEGLRSGLRQDPDAMLIGEIRDPETARMALSAAETGHLIFSTLHTRDAKGAVTRFVDLFPHEAQDDVRAQLSLSLRSVICQHLLPPASGEGKRALALEIMHVNNPVRAGIRWGKIESIDSAIQTGKRDGMMTLDEDLHRLAAAGLINTETVRKFAKDQAALGGRRT